MKSLMENKTWKLVNKPKDHKIVRCKWIYKFKEGTNPNNPPRYKAKLVAKGFTQNEGIDYNEIFSHVIKYKTIRLIFALIVQFNWELEHLILKQYSYTGNWRRIFTCVNFKAVR